MRLILEERELIHLRKILVCMVMKRFRDSAYLFSERQYREWAFEAVDEGIGVALQATDWKPELAKDTDEKTLQGLKVWFIYMKARNVARRDLRQEARHHKACRFYQVKTSSHDEELELVLTRTDIQRAFPKLSQDQRAAFALVHFADVSIEDAAVILKRSRGALDMLLTRARKVIGESLQTTVSTAPAPRTKRGRPRKQQHLRSQKGEDPLSSVECV